MEDELPLFSEQVGVSEVGVEHDPILHDVQSTLLPKGICNSIDKWIRNFLWGSTLTKMRCHLVQWDVVTRLKDEGGLDIRTTKGMHMAFMTKLGWRFLMVHNKLWVKVMINKYSG